MIDIGTDIYLSWDKMTKEDEKKQICGFGIGNGQFGYIRASIGMVTENSILHLVFPKEMWHAEGATEYHFSEKVHKLILVISLRYLQASLTGETIRIDSEEMKEAEELSRKTADILQKMLNADEVQESGSLNYRNALTWIDSLLSFYELGMQKQKDGLHPKVEISW